MSHHIVFLQNVLWWRHFLWQARHIITGQHGARVGQHQIVTQHLWGYRHLWGWGGSWGKNTWFRLCWSTLDRRSSTTLARIPSSYTYTTITPVPVTILKELISRELVQIINKERMVTLERGSAATTTKWTSSPGPGFLPHKQQNINVDGTGPVRFNLN